MTLCLEMSAFNSNIGTDYKTKSNNARELLRIIGFEQFDTNSYYEEKPTADSIGVLAANKKVRYNGLSYRLVK